MSRTLTTIILTFIVGICFGQEGFKPGYYIDNQGIKKECLIKIEESATNPTQLEYKNGPSESSLIATISEVAEFGIPGVLKFKRASVAIDRSSINVTKLWTVGTEPEYTNETLFLRLLIEGTASLYIYEDNGLTKYFYNVGGSQIEQLMFRVYKGKDNAIIENNEYRQQLWEDVKCESTTLTGIRKVQYNQSALVGHFKIFHDCSDSAYTDFTKFSSVKKDFSNKTIRIRMLVGTNNSSIHIKHDRFDIDQNLGSQWNIMVGAELEFTLPFTGKTWSAMFQPNIRTFESQADLREEVTVKYSSFSTAIGIRKYIPLSSQTALFVSAYTNLSIPLTENIPITWLPEGLTYPTGSNFMFGFGININEKLSVEAKYLLERDLLSSFSEWVGEYSSFSFQLGYRLF